MTMTTKYFWAKIELLGRRVRYGRCSTVDFLGTQMLRVEVPYPEKQTKPAEPMYAAEALNSMHEVVLSLECKKARVYPPATEMTREAMIEALLKINNADEEQFASVEEYAPGALYSRQLLTEEQVRKALEPWKPAAPYALPQGNEDPFDGEWEESEGPTSERAFVPMAKTTLSDNGQTWSHEYLDVDGDKLFIQSPRTHHDKPHIAEIGVIVDKSPTIAIWCPNFAQLKALHNRIGDILVDYKFYSSADTSREMAPRWIDINEHSYVAAHIDLEDCPRCKGAKLHPQISLDGSAYEADHCTVCGGTWWAAYPVPAKPEMVRSRQPDRHGEILKGSETAIEPAKSYKYIRAWLEQQPNDTLETLYFENIGFFDMNGTCFERGNMIETLVAIEGEPIDVVGAMPKGFQTTREAIEAAEARANAILAEKDENPAVPHEDAD